MACHGVCPTLCPPTPFCRDPRTSHLCPKSPCFFLLSFWDGILEEFVVNFGVAPTCSRGMSYPFAVCSALGLGWIERLTAARWSQQCWHLGWGKVWETQERDKSRQSPSNQKATKFPIWQLRLWKYYLAEGLGLWLCLFHYFGFFFLIKNTKVMRLFLW